MGLSCSCDFDDADWYFEPAEDFSLLATKRGRKCCSCDTKIKPGEDVLRLRRWRGPHERCNYLEERIYGDEVPMTPWFMCEECGGLYMAVSDLGMCCDIMRSIAEQIKEYREEEKGYVNWLTPNADS